MIENIFHLKENKTNIRTEVLAGLTTFMTMAYILAVNPGILSETGMNKNALFTATAISAVVATLVMALWANLPFALAPGMGLNAFFTYTVVLGMGYSWELALTAVFTEGIIFIVLTFFNVREAIVNSIPNTLKHAISVGIGLFIAFIGLRSAGIITGNKSTMVTLGNMSDRNVWIALFGILLTGILLVKKVRGALLIGIILSALLGIPLGITHLPAGHIISLPPSIKPIFFKFQFSHLFTADMLVILFTFLFVDIFDTVGTLVGVSSKAGLLDKNGNVPRVKQALFADAIGTTAGALLGTSTVTTYVESAAGVTEGGKTGLTSFTVAIMFIIALLFSPVFLMVPAAATAPALIIVGLFMLEPVIRIDFGDYTESVPAFLTIIMMPLTSSISEGIVFGMLSYVVINTLTGRWKKISLVMYILSIFFVLKFFI